MFRAGTFPGYEDVPEGVPVDERPAVLIPQTEEVISHIVHYIS